MRLLNWLAELRRRHELVDLWAELRRRCLLLLNHFRLAELRRRCLLLNHFRLAELRRRRLPKLIGRLLLLDRLESSELRLRQGLLLDLSRRQCKLDLKKE